LVKRCSYLEAVYGGTSGHGGLTQKKYIEKP